MDETMRMQAVIIGLQDELRDLVGEIARLNSEIERRKIDQHYLNEDLLRARSDLTILRQENRWLEQELAKRS
jgi:hypothetical protein